jgi:hypothetical protein
MTDLVQPASAFGLPPECVVAFPADDEVLWRITRHEEPSLFDFFSFAKMGDPNRGPAILAVGVSMYSTQSQAEAARDRFRRGQFVVPVRLPHNGGFSVARTRRTPGHHTVWGTPEKLLAAARETAE